MFKKLRQSQKKNIISKNVTSYSQLQANRTRLKDISYSRLHQIRKATPSSSLDFHVVCNQHYIYQGEWRNSQKDGEGIAFLKNGTMIVGHWLRDKLNGRSLIFTPYGAMLSVQFIDNKINGWCLAQYCNKLVIINLYFQDKVDGPRITFQGSQQMWVASNFTQFGQFLQITNVEKGHRNKLPIFLQNDELSYLFQKIITNKQFGFNFQKIKCIQVVPGTQFIGFIDEHSLPKGLGATYSVNECFMGYFNKGYLNQFGRMIFGNGDIYHGGLFAGEFSNHGIYYNPKKNNTIVMLTYDDGEVEVIEDQKGYYLVDFQLKIGQRISKQDRICLSASTQSLIKILENYYQQYCIQTKKYQQEKFSILSQNQTDPNKPYENNQQDSMKTNEFIKPQRRGSLSKWLVGQENQGYSEQASEQQQPRKSQGFQNSYYEPNSPTSKKGLNNQFFSITIKQNEQFTEKQKYQKQNPQQNKYKQKLFIPENKFMNSKSLDIQQLTFRNQQKKENIKQRKTQIQKNSLYEYQNIYQQSRVPVIQVHEIMSEQSSSNVSNIEQKLNGVMKKSSLRRKIFH